MLKLEVVTNEDKFYTIEPVLMITVIGDLLCALGRDSDSLAIVLSEVKACHLSIKQEDTKQQIQIPLPDSTH